MTLHKNDICTVKVVLPGNWAEWYLARIECFEDDEGGNWQVTKFQVCGEKFLRDSYEGCYVIHDEQRQKQAKKLAATLWAPKAFKSLDEVRAAIMEIWT